MSLFSKAKELAMYPVANGYVVKVSEEQGSPFVTQRDNTFVFSNAREASLFIMEHFNKGESE
jgi:hypothetical protein